MELKDNEIRSIERELLNLSLELGLFIDAGLITSSAFNEIIKLNENNDHPLYIVLRSIQKECVQKNADIVNELFLFAERIKSKPFMRFAALLIDNKSTGSLLSDKLEKEREQMQNFNLNDAKARAKKAETKLCFPLMLLLISIIVISSAPALMQM